MEPRRLTKTSASRGRPLPDAHLPTRGAMPHSAEKRALAAANGGGEKKVAERLSPCSRAARAVRPHESTQ
ncbi:hypothetical protein NDU88_004777 [Pleurodeles waltl]|uniref:Uncharacterized protein n=1 Tax=Pleurodeles waltl TaxID=8319 RepID=A0AAV7PGR2_PLEWA|nr:hypothetical protein NDU88_004777 [Pleurodeles waltl]